MLDLLSKNSFLSRVFFYLGLLFFTCILCSEADAGRVADIKNTKHNLSSGGAGTIKAVTENQLCVFCHTPHGSENIPQAPLWNRKLSTLTYTPYTSTSMDATDLAQPSNSSKLCLTCHDGTQAIGAVNVLSGAYTDQNPATADINVSGTGAGGVMPGGASGATSGYTRNLGIDLTNDHPISFTYNSVLAANDGELYDPALPAGSHIKNRSSGVKPAVPLINNMVECATCHDPHVR